MSISTRASPSPEPAVPSRRPVALVTGASVGIGLELAKLLAGDGHDLVLVSRDQARLMSLAEQLCSAATIKSRVISIDLSQAGACDHIARDLIDAGIEIDVLINNAGFGIQGDFWEADLQKQLDLLQVNIVALTHLTRLLLPGMIARGWGRIMNVASVAGFVPGPYMACYYASKAYVLSFSMALSQECRGRGVSVTAVCPGPTRTEFFTRAGINDTPIVSGQMMSAEEVARIGYKAMLRGKPLVVTGVMNKLLAQATRLIPRAMAARVAATRNRLRGAK